ncbi:MAG: DUF4334 domain-containing protein [Kaiparowitsia implicata GSE-PSE-MK54-09C]|jgi:hypothetical protein|nr:DUF4334 domain-containing protein [Kaiparowitsia implicata GSE-PSE-MK54-09C]
MTRSSTAEALAIFDSLAPVEIDFMMGAWKGAGIPTEHPLDGVLEAYHWHGKWFDSADHVHPLVFTTLTGDKVSVDPVWFMPVMGWVDQVPIPKSTVMGRMFQGCLALVSTRRSCARLCLTTYRGKESATMIYDALPIHDIFRKVDENTVLGLMDLKGMKQPFFFMLQRE